MTVIFVGDRPSDSNTDPAVAFVGTQSYVRLMRIIEGAGVVGVVLCNAYNMDGEAQDIPKALKYVALGNNASDRLNELGIQHLKLPHPSGVNRFWNNEGAEAECIERLKEYVAKK